MKLYHDSQNPKYRTPYGAVPTSTAVSLMLDAWDFSKDENHDDAFASLIIRTDKSEDIYPMTKTCGNATSDFSEDLITFRAEVTLPETPCLCWYMFVVNCGDKELRYVNASKKGGVGKTVSDRSCDSYQITVYDKDFNVPQWFKGRIMYQIFPDRFYGFHPDGSIPKSRDEYIIHYNRYEDIAFNSHHTEDGPACNDFYGGNLQGIIKKLPYIKSLGVGVIYLNPIFEAYSNHKYDTANYKKIDPMFGTEEDFCNLCQEAEKLDIRIILDGVFSHTGADSIYFNKYGYYGDGGAYNHCDSPYRSWYSFDSDNGYQSWWGCSNLPNVNELQDSYLDYILRDEDSVIKKWLRLGAYGWRLDVADELPDEFIKILRREVKAVKPDAVIIGEVWEDASDKIAYGKRREYLLGDELDSVMNYPFKDCVSSFLTGKQSSEDMDAVFNSIYENYPLQTVYSLMNLLGTHDTMRIKSFFGEADSDCGSAHLQSGMEDLAAYRYMCAVFMQMTMPGVPSIYYGDEVGMQGGRDPFNRQPFPWRQCDVSTLESVRYLGSMRNNIPVLKSGFIKTLYSKENLKEDIYLYMRYFKNGTDVFGDKYQDKYKSAAFPVICGINRSFESKTVTVTVPFDIKSADTLVNSGGAIEAEILSAHKEQYKSCTDLRITLPAIGYTAIMLKYSDKINT